MKDSQMGDYLQGCGIPHRTGTVRKRSLRYIKYNIITYMRVPRVAVLMDLMLLY